MNYEQIKLANGSRYDVVPGGITASGDKLTIIVLMGSHTLSEIDIETDNSSNTGRIEVLDSLGDVMDIKKDYIYQTGCRKQKDYVVGRETVDTGTFDEEGNSVVEYQDIIATVAMIELSQADLRKEVNNLKETVDMLIVSNLEG